MELTIKASHLDPNDERSELIHLPHLERLYIDNVTLLAVLETPSLQQLRIDFAFLSFYDNGGIIASAFLRRCGNKLSTIVIYRGPLGVVKDILLSAPELDQLALFDVTMIGDPFKWMAGTGMQVRFNTLRVSWDRDWSPGLGPLHDLIARRNPPNDKESLSPKELLSICLKWIMMKVKRRIWNRCAGTGASGLGSLAQLGDVMGLIFRQN